MNEKITQHTCKWIVCDLYRRLQLYLACLLEGIECTVMSGSAMQPLGPSLSPMLRVMSRD